MTAQFTTDLFSFKAKTFSAFASDLRGGGKSTILLTNPKTGGTARFEFVREARCGTLDNELQAWHFRCPDKDLSMVIFND